MQSTFFSVTVLAIFLLTGSEGKVPHVPKVGTPINGYVSVKGKAVHSSRVHVFAASTGLYGSKSVSLLDSKQTTLQDEFGAYVLTDGQGLFSFSATVPCTPGTVLYVYSMGGNLPGYTKNNDVIGLLALIGRCTPEGRLPSLPNAMRVDLDTTIITAAIFARHATDATHVSMATEPSR